MSLPARPLWCLVVSSSLFVAAPSELLAQQGPERAQAQGRSVAQLWEDFNHYVLIARPELAAAAGQALLQQTDLPALLEAVEQSDYRNYQSTLDRAKATGGQLAEVASQLEQTIQQARVQVSREPERIAGAIQRLGEGGRPYRNAVVLLRAAGQFAVPQMLEALRDDQNQRLDPYIMSALVEMGHPAVAPLARALPYLQPATQSQVAQVLAEIGYPFPAVAYMRQTLENQRTDPGARRAVETAYNVLIAQAGVPADATAAQLFLTLGEGRYAQETRGEEIVGYDASADQGIVWEFGERTGLVAVPVPGPVYGDVLAMKASGNALDLNPQLDQALSLWLASNLRRENNLPEGAEDPSYPASMQPASFYTMLAGPARQHDVLARALADNDAALALDAIEALDKTAGTNALLSEGRGQQPLLRALGYPDRRVRFRAAEALANARPQDSFSGADRVVPVLAEAIRPAGQRYALVLASNQNRVNELLASVGDQGFEAFGGVSLPQVQSEVTARPGVDLIVVDLEPQRVRDLLRETAGDYKLGATPVLALTSRDRQISLQETLGDVARLSTAADMGDAQSLASAVDQALQAGGNLSEEQADEFAVTALSLLRDAALANTVYDVSIAEPALIAALQDERDEVVTGAADVLAMINSARAQEAIARNALEVGGDLQIALLDSLAESATHHGKLIGDNLTNQVLQLVQRSEGDTALAAARAHGALSLPTQNAVQLIAGQGPEQQARR